MQHNLRQKHANNVDLEKSKDNVIYYQHIKNVEELKAYYENLEVKEKSNSVKAMEFVFTASPEFFEKATPGQLEKWKDEQVAFAKSQWGDNLQFLVLHNDEKSPHFHAMVSVEETKTHKYKNQKGEFFKKVTSLNARKYNRDYLRNLQTVYAERNKKFGLHRGLKNSNARHTELKEFQATVKKSIEADYEKNIAKAFEKEFANKKRLGYISYDDVKAFMLHHLNNVYRSKKILKDRDDLTKQYRELANKANEILKSAGDIKDLRDEYFETVKNGQKLKEDNRQLTDEVNQLKKKYEPEIITDHPVSNKGFDSKIKIR